jgi:hypothetical protein
MIKLLESNIIGGGIKRDHYRSPKATIAALHWGHSGSHTLFYINHNLNTRFLEVIPIIKASSGGWPTNSTVGACVEAYDYWYDWNLAHYGSSQGWYAFPNSDNQLQAYVRSSVGGQLIFDIYRLSPEEDIEYT